MRAWFLASLLIASGLLPRGADAADPVQVASGRQPQVAIDPAGIVYVIYGADDAAWCAVSTDGGKTFGAPVKVGNPTGSMPLGKRRGPRVAATEKAVVVTAIWGGRGKGKDGDLLAWRSTDQGKTWQGPTRLNAEGGAAREGLHGMAAGGGEKLFCDWLDLRNGKTELWGALSTDGGATWGKDFLLYHSPGGTICECCHPSAAFDAKGGVLAMFRNALEGNRDMYLVRSSADAKKFDAGQKLGTGAWRLDRCPMDGGAVCGGGDGAVYTVWRRQQKVFLAAPGAAEKELGGGEQPWLAPAPKGAHVVWVARRGGELMYQPPTGAAARVADRAVDPVIASAPGGKGPVVAAWESEDNHVLALVVAPAVK